MAAKVNITVDQGADFIYNVFLVDSGGSPVDLDGFTGRCQFRTSYSSPNYANVNVSLNDPSTGAILLTMNSASTANLTSTRYVYDVEVISNTSIVSRIMEGIITVNPNVTR